MPNIKCSYPDCPYETGEVSDNIAIELLKIHGPVHAVTTSNENRTTKQKAPKITRPAISDGASEETWDSFTARWSMFTRGTQLDADGKATLPML